MFTGFTQDTINFLYALRFNNHKTWFDEHRAEYEQHLRNVFKSLVQAMTPYMLEIDPLMDMRPNKCISRINRDVRFSKDKSPYRSNMWVSFKREYRDWKQEPTFYFELFPDGYRYGMGFYDMPKEHLEKLRRMIEEDNEEFHKIHELYKKQKTFILAGNSYKRILNKDIPEELLEWYQKKEVYFVCDRTLNDAVFSEKLLDELVQGFQLLVPVYHFFMQLKGGTES